jgi:hypothetical protein
VYPIWQTRGQVDPLAVPMQGERSPENVTNGAMVQGFGLQVGTLIHDPSRQRAVGALGEYPVWQEMAHVDSGFVGTQVLRLIAFAITGAVVQGAGSQVGRLIHTPRLQFIRLFEGAYPEIQVKVQN